VVRKSGSPRAEQRQPRQNFSFKFAAFGVVMAVREVG
jgi:hypothetical protein